MVVKQHLETGDLGLQLSTLDLGENTTRIRLHDRTFDSEIIIGVEHSQNSV